MNMNCHMDLNRISVKLRVIGAYRSPLVLSGVFIKKFLKSVFRIPSKNIKLPYKYIKSTF